MEQAITNQIKQYLLDYLKKRIPDFKIKGKLFKCPNHHLHSNKSEEYTCNEFPPNSGKLHCFAPECGKLGTIFDICRKIDFDGCEDVPDEDIANFLIDEFKIKINQDQNKIFDLYESLKWDMVPVEKNRKESWIEKEWQLKNHLDKNEWQQWIHNGINMGVQTGKKSNNIGIDIDLLPSDLKKQIYSGKFTEKQLTECYKIYEENLVVIKEQMPFLDWTTLQQKTFGGVHLFYLYDLEIPKSNFNITGIHIDVQSDGGQIVIEPSIVGGQNRQIIGTELKPLPKELKEFILSKKSKPTEDNIISENLDVDLTFDNLNSNRNNTFISLYGKLRREMPIKVAYNTLLKFNNLLDKKVPIKDIQAMSREAEKYHEVDIQRVSEEIIAHFKIVKHEVHLRDLKEVLHIERGDIEQALRYLLDKNKIYKIKKDVYHLITDVEWRTDFMTLSKPLNIMVPYFHPYARFNQGSMIVIGGKTGTGKSHCCVNMIEQFVKQGICPKLITTEADSGVGEIAISRGLKEGDFKFWQTSDPLTVPFKQDEVRIIDWLKAPNSEFFKLDTIYEGLNNNLVNFGGLLIVFAQLKKDTNTFYAENMVEQFASLVAKFNYPERNGVIDNLHPELTTTKIRRPKTNKQYLKIPLEYIPETKELRAK